MSATCLLAPKNILWKILESYGHDPEPLFLKEDIDLDMMMEPGRRISYTKSHNLWKSAAELIKDPCFGLRAVGFWHPSHFNALGYAWLASVTLREALYRFDRYVHMISQKTETHLEENDEGLSVVLANSIEVPAFMDLTMTILTSMCRLNLGGNFEPLAVSFIHSEPSCADEFHYYFRAPLFFNADDDRITISAADANRRLATGNKHLARLNDKYILSYLAGLKKQDFLIRVKRAFFDLLPSGRISIQRVASRLNMSVRSLQRRLYKEGTTFSKIVDDMRRDLAKDYIRDPGTTLMEIAFMLGFSSYSAFSRAYKRWTGMSPGEARRRLIATN